MGSVYVMWAFLQYLAILATADDGSAKFPGGNGLNKAPSVTSDNFKMYNGSSKDEPIFPSSKTTYRNTSGDNISASEDDFLSFKMKRSSGDAPCHSKVEGNDTQTVGSFEGASASLYFKASEHFQRMEVNLRLRGYLRLSRVQILNERFSVEDLGVADDLDRWHMLHVGVYAEGSEFLGSEWKIFVFNDADSAVSSKAACLRRPTDEVVGLDIAASGPSEWRCDKPAGFTNPSPRTSRSRASGRHHPSVVAFAVGLLALLGFLTSVVFLLRFLLKKKKMMKRRREDRAVLHQRDIETEQRRTTEGISNEAARPVSSHSSENSLYGVVIATDTNE